MQISSLYMEFDEAIMVRYLYKIPINLLQLKKTPNLINKQMKNMFYFYHKVLVNLVLKMMPNYLVFVFVLSLLPMVLKQYQQKILLMHLLINKVMSDKDKLVLHQV